MINDLIDILRNYADEHDLLFAPRFNTHVNVYGFYFRDREGTWIFWREYTSREIREWSTVGAGALAMEIIDSLEKKIERMRRETDG